jgi:hypothetical protein
MQLTPVLVKKAHRVVNEVEPHSVLPLLRLQNLQTEVQSRHQMHRHVDKYITQANNLPEAIRFVSTLNEDDRRIEWYLGLPVLICVRHQYLFIVFERPSLLWRHCDSFASTGAAFPKHSKDEDAKWDYLLNFAMLP